mmetsp:Transcript_103291/g.308565  ORF Transcript_103291/g.308565 Transcript_103291/m.308565 type:complete len:200 (-) Transcript_103291:888-1487(-)
MPAMKVSNSNQPQAMMKRMPESMPAMAPVAVTNFQRPEKSGTTSVMVRMSAIEKRSVSFTARPSIVALSFAEYTAKSMAGMLMMSTKTSTEAMFFHAGHFCFCCMREIVEVMAVWKESALEAIIETTRMYMMTLMALLHCGISRISKKTNGGIGLRRHARPRSWAFSSMPVRPKMKVRKLTISAPTTKPIRRFLTSFAA